MKNVELAGHTLTDGTKLTCPSAWLIPEADDKVCVIPTKPLKVVWPSGSRVTILPTDKVACAVVQGKFVADVVDHATPALTKEQGMALAYEKQVPDRENFEALAYYLFLTTPPPALISTNEVWTLWRNLKWPEPPKRGFAGPVMRAGEQRGWGEFVREIPNTAGNSHSNLLVRGYVSNIYREDHDVIPVPTRT